MDRLQGTGLIKNEIYAVTIHGSGTRTSCAFRENMIQERGAILLYASPARKICHHQPPERYAITSRRGDLPSPAVGEDSQSSLSGAEKHAVPLLDRLLGLSVLFQRLINIIQQHRILFPYCRSVMLSSEPVV